MRLWWTVPWLVATLAACAGCDTPATRVVVENDFAPATAFVVYRAFWQAVAFPKPLAPGDVSDAASTVPASDNPAYAVVAPGWDSASATAPAALLVLQSRAGFAVDLNETLRIAVDDKTFAGDCAAGSSLTQAEADFITGRVFADVFAGRTYDAATCTTSAAP